MAVTIGATPDAGFDEPLRLLADCHRRIELFLDVLGRLATDAEGVLLPDRRAALERAVTYFAEAAPRHNEDEERSLFPRMRASQDPEVQEALAALKGLEADHQRSSHLLDEVERHARNWLRFGRLEVAAAAQLRALLVELRDLFSRHIEVEERLVFSAAGRALDAPTLMEIGREMAVRRGVSWGSE